MFHHYYLVFTVFMCVKKYVMIGKDFSIESVFFLWPSIEKSLMIGKKKPKTIQYEFHFIF